MTEIILVEVDSQPIELCKLLKIANLVGGGGEAKMVISEGYVAVNNEVEFQKRKKIYHEDFVEFNGEVIQLHVDESLAEPPSQMPIPQPEYSNKADKANANKKSTSKGHAKSKNKSATNKQQSASKTLNVTKRKPISF